MLPQQVIALEKPLLSNKNGFVSNRAYTGNLLGMVSIQLKTASGGASTSISRLS